MRTTAMLSMNRHTRVRVKSTVKVGELAWTTGLLASTVVALVTMSQGCGFNPRPAAVDDNPFLMELPTVSAYQSHRSIVYDMPGKFQAQHGYACADPGATGDFVFKIQDSAAIPNGDDATIIFNGWIEKFDDGDHPLRVLAPGRIFDVETTSSPAGQNELHWSAGGGLGYGQPYSWCYFYTLVFWHPDNNELAAKSANNPVPERFAGPGQFLDAQGSPGPVHSIAGHLETPDASEHGVPRAVVPRGYQFWYDDGNNEHNLLQAGFDLSNDVPAISGNAISWTSEALLKDNDGQPFGAGMSAALLIGPSVSMWQPVEVWHRVVESNVRPSWELVSAGFKLTARDADTCWYCTSVGINQPTVWNDYAVEVPFKYAVPMLTGWDLGDAFSDHHVLQVGAYIDHFRFVPSGNGRSGRLYYTVVSTYEDDGSSDGNVTSNKVTVLGFNPIDRTAGADLLNPIPPVSKQ